MSTLHPTSGLAWRAPREEGILVELLSGNLARLRPVSIPALLASGEIPDLLTPLVAQVLTKGIDATTETLEKALAAAEAGEGDDNAAAVEAFRRLRDMTTVFDVVCKAVFVSPRIVDSAQSDDEISAADLDLQDKLQVVHLATQPLEVLRRFRYEPPADVATLPDGEDVGAEAEPADGD